MICEQHSPSSSNATLAESMFHRFTVLTGIIAGLTLGSCTRLDPKVHTHPSGKAQVQKPGPRQPKEKPGPVASNMNLWPDSWKEYHTRFNNYVDARKNYWPRPEIKFQEPNTLEWNAIAPTRKKYVNSDITDSIQFFRFGRHYLTRGDEGVSKTPQFPGVYAASVWRFIKGYQHMSPPFYFSVVSQKEGASGKLSTHVEPYTPKSEWDIFPNQWWYYNTDFHIWDTSDMSPRDFFTSPRPFKPTISLEEAEGTNSPIVKRNLLSPELEDLLELRLYYEGKLMQTKPAAGIESWTFDHGPGHYVYLIVAADNQGGALIVARPFQAWFPDEGDGILRIIPKDTDKDGMPDYWEKWHDLDPTNPEDADKPYQKSKKTSYLDYFKNQKIYNKVR